MPDTLMTGAELRTLREAVGLTLADLGSLVNVQGRSIKHWESGRSGVPADVGTVVQKLDAQFTLATQEAVAQTLTALKVNYLLPGDEFVLLRYASTEDLHLFRPDMRRLPATAQGALVGRIRIAVQALGLNVRIVYMQPQEYQAWRRIQGMDDDEVARSQWAALQVSAQTLPRPGTNTHET